MKGGKERATANKKVRKRDETERKNDRRKQRETHKYKNERANLKDREN